METPFTRRFGVDHPLIQAGMGEAGPALAAAVSNAGALGSLGTIGKSPDTVEQEIAETRKLTDRPFAVNVVTFDWSPFASAVIEAVVRAVPPAITLSFGDPVAGIGQAKAAGILTMVQAQRLDTARQAIDAGADLVIAQGNEAGGHTGGDRGTLSFTAEVLEMAGDLPVGAAGGIGNGRGLAAVLAMGGSVAVVGTRFKTCPEYPGPQREKDEILAASGEATTADPVTDAAYVPLVWPEGVVGRAIRNKFTDQWEGRLDEIQKAVAAEPEMFGFLAGLAKQDTSVNWGGQSAGLVHRAMPAAEVVAEIVSDAGRRLQEATKLVAV